MGLDIDKIKTLVWPGKPRLSGHFWYSAAFLGDVVPSLRPEPDALRVKPISNGAKPSVHSLFAPSNERVGTLGPILEKAISDRRNCDEPVDSENAVKMRRKTSEVGGSGKKAARKIKNRRSISAFLFGATGSFKQTDL